MSSRNHSSPLPSCFRPASDQRSLPPPPPPSLTPNLTTSLYHTNIALFALTWSRTLFGRSLHLNLHLHNSAATTDTDDDFTSSTTSPTFHLHIKPFLFWKKQGSKKLTLTTTAAATTHQSAHIYWDLSKTKFDSGPEPVSEFYIAVVINGELTLLVGDSHKQAYSKTKSSIPDKTQITILRREHVSGIANRRYTTKASFAGKTRNISIDCRITEHDSRLNFHVDNKRVLQVKHLAWKFRGNERVEVDGVYVQVSWDVYNWLFEEDKEDGHALFMFRFEKSGFDYDRADDDEHYLTRLNGYGSGFGLEFEAKKMKKSGMLGTARSSASSSSFSLSSASSCGSVMEWESVEENELKGPSGFSLLVYAWKR